MGTGKVRVGLKMPGTCRFVFSFLLGYMHTFFPNIFGPARLEKKKILLLPMLSTIVNSLQWELREGSS